MQLLGTVGSLHAPLDLTDAERCMQQLRLRLSRVKG